MNICRRCDEKLGEVSYICQYSHGLDYNINRPEYVVNPLENTSIILTWYRRENWISCLNGNFEENIIYCIHIEEYFKYIQDNARSR